MYCPNMYLIPNSHQTSPKFKGTDDYQKGMIVQIDARSNILESALV